MHRVNEDFNMLTHAYRNGQWHHNIHSRSKVKHFSTNNTVITMLLLVLMQNNCNASQNVCHVCYITHINNDHYHLHQQQIICAGVSFLFCFPHTCLQLPVVVFHRVINGLLQWGRPNQLKCNFKLGNQLWLLLQLVLRLQHCPQTW